MTKFISIFFLIFNIFSKDINIILKVQNVIKNNENKEDLSDIFVKNIKITEDKITKLNYKPVELLDFFDDEVKEDLKKIDVSNKNILVSIGNDFYLKPDIIDANILKNINEKEDIKIFYRDKRKYDIKMYNRFFIKDSIKISNETFTKEDFISTLNNLDKKFNNEYCCFLKNVNVLLNFTKNNIEIADKSDLVTCNYKNELNFVNPIYYNKTCNFKISDKNNNCKNCNGFVMCKNLYYSLYYLKLLLSEYNLDYQDIEYIKYNNNCEFKFENEDFKNIENLEEKLYNTKLNENNISEVKLKITLEKNKKLNKKKYYCQNQS